MSRASGYLAGEGRQSVLASTYLSGLTLLLMRSIDEEPRFSAELVRALVDGYSKKAGLFRYDTGRGGQVGGTGPANLSTSQLACLGLAGAYGMPMEKGVQAVWQDHMAALTDSQMADGAWPYRLAQEPADIGQSYPTAAYMGTANFILARMVLAGDLVEGEEKAAEAENRRAAAENAVRRFCRWTLRGLRGAHTGFVFPLYEWLALEKACVLLDKESLADTRWYIEGAERLLRMQRPNGSWVPGEFYLADVATYESEKIGTAYALLFLLRWTEVTVKEPRKRRTTTPADGPPGAAPADSPAPTLENLLESSLRLAGLAGDPMAPPQAVLATLVDCATAFDLLYPTLAGAERERVGRALGSAALRVVVRTPEQAGTHQERRLRARAARVLGDLPPGSVLEPSPLLKMLDALLDNRRSTVDEMHLLTAAFDALARQGGAESVTWLVRRACDTSQGTSATIARVQALLALESAPALDAPTLKAVGAAICTTYAPIEAVVAKLDQGGAVRTPREMAARKFWWQLSPDVLIALERIAARMSPNGQRPSSSLGRSAPTVAEYCKVFGLPR